MNNSVMATTDSGTPVPADFSKTESLTNRIQDLVTTIRRLRHATEVIADRVYGDVPSQIGVGESAAMPTPTGNLWKLDSALDEAFAATEQLSAEIDRLSHI